MVADDLLMKHDDRVAVPERVIDASERSLSLGLRDLYKHRELAWIFLKRQIAVRYRQMALGVFWAVLEPLGLLVMMSIVFGMLLRVDTGEYPYPVFAFAGLIPWLLFSKATLSASASLVENIGLISKVYFPRIVLPFISVARELFDSGVAFLVLIAIAAVSGYWPGWKLLLAPALMLWICFSAFALGLWLACLMVPFRDMRPLLALVMQAGMYATPVLYPPNLVPASVLPYYQLNPMYWAVEAMRWILLDRPIEFSMSFVYSIALVLATFALGLVIFSKSEKSVVDVQ